MKKGNKIAMIVVLLLVVVFGVGQFFASPIAPANPPAPTPAISASANQTPGTSTASTTKSLKF